MNARIDLSRPVLRATPRLRALLTALALLLIVGVGAAFRFHNLHNWDGGTGFHPDERFIQYTVAGLQLPANWDDYFRSQCADPLPVPRNPGASLDKLEPSTASGCSTLNPRNFDWSRNFQYGSLPLTLTRLATETLDQTDAQQIVVLGRTLAALADTLTIVTTFCLGWLLAGRRVGLLAAAFYACAVMPIQQAHYFTTDAFAVCFGTLALLFITRLALRGGWPNTILSGICIGAAMACKINMASLALLVPLAAVLQTIGNEDQTTDRHHQPHNMQPRIAYGIGLLVVAGLTALATFRVLQPDAFAGPNWWNLALEPRFLETTREAQLTADGTRDLPYLIQWAGRTRWWYGWQNMVQWGMGVPLGLAAWVGVAVAGWQLVTQRRWSLLIPFAWVLGYFGWIGAQLLMTMRYFLPVYPALMVFAALVLCSTVAGWHGRIGARWNVPAIKPFNLAVLQLVVVVATLAWAWGYSHIYTQPYTRIAAAEWLKQREPDGAVTTFEVWDDPLPFNDPRYTQIATEPYAEETIDKYLRANDTLDEAGLINQLAQTDYVVLTSPRVYDSVSRMPQRYPAITRYYQALFDGSLGFKQIAVFESFPSLGPIQIDDTRAEEAFWVYDHPRVLIFERTPEFTAERATQRIMDGIVWDELYHGLRPSQINATPAALLMTDTAWQQWSTAAALPDSGLGVVGNLVLWVVALEVLGLATCGLLWRARLRLPDRGLGLSRVVGALLFGVPPVLLVAHGGVPLNRLLLGAWYGLLVLGGGLLLWRDRRKMLRWARRRGTVVWLPHLLYSGVLVLGLGLTSMLEAPTANTARWAALVRTPVLPPPDLFFAGGHDPLPYAAQLPFALLAKVLGVPAGEGLRLALATALALTSLVLWSAFWATWRRGLHGMRLALGIAVVLVPGVMLAQETGWSPWLSLAQGDLDTLGVALLAASGLALSVGAARARSWALVLLLLPLVLLHGYGLDIALALSAGVAIILWALAWTPARRVAGVGIALLALVLGVPLGWSVAPPALQTLPVGGTLASMLMSLVLPLAILLAFAVLRPVRWQRITVWALAGLALGIVGITVLVVGGRLRGDLQHMMAVAGVLLSAGAGGAVVNWRTQGKKTQSLRTLVWGHRLRPVMRVGTPLVVVLALVSTAGRMQNELAATTQAGIDAQAARAVANAGSVLVAAPQSAAQWSAASGTPALLAVPERERRLRDWFQPAIDGVIETRLTALQTIYGPDSDAAQRTLNTYHVGTIILGPTERALFPDAAGTLERLAQQNVATQVYEQNDTTVFRYTPPAATPPFVAQPIELQPRATDPLLLDQPVSSLSPVNEYAWNQLAVDQPLVGVVLWLLVIELAGLLAFPLVRRIFWRWHDQGWGLSKIVGLLLWGYAVWLPVSWGWWPFNRFALLVGALLVGLLSGAVWLWDRQQRVSLPRFHISNAMLRAELWFLGAFALWTLVRAANPDLWHPIYGGEKPFEFGFLNAILRSPVMPPYDPFFSDGVINYYYYGLFLMALPVKATGMAPAVGFNLALALLFALTTTMGLTLGRHMTGRWRWGMLAVFLMVGIGPLASVFQIGEGGGLGSVTEALNGGLSGFGSRIGAWFWGPSRIIDGTINEFPLFAFLFGDLHPHLIALPIMLLAVACALELGRRPRPLLVALGTLVLGTLAAANSWDAPTAALLIGGTLVGRAWLQTGRRNRIGDRLSRVSGAAALAIGMLATGVLLYWPFFSRYRAQVGGVGRVEQGDSIMEWLLWFGPLLFVVITLLAVLAWRVARRTPRRWRWAARGLVLTIPLLPLVLLLSGFVSQQADSGMPLQVLLGALGGLGALLALRLRMALRTWFGLWLIIVGVLVALGVQLIFVRDHLAGSDWQRMNTVFKFGFQIWVLWALGAATTLPLIVRALRRYQLAFGVWLGLLGALLLPGLAYPLAGIPSRLATRFDTEQPLTLDGLAFMDRATYRYQPARDAQPVSISLQPDADAIRWINQHISGTPVFLTSELEFYRAYGMRIAANTGLPTVLGKLHQDEQRDGRVVAERERDVQTLWNTVDVEQTQRLLRRYNVEYVYVGPIERLLYNQQGIAKFEQLAGSLLSVAYQNPGVTIYRVDQQALNMSGEPPQIQAVYTETQTLEAAYAAAPQDSGAAFALGRHYLGQERAADALRVLEPAARLHPTDVPLLHLWGDALLRAGRPTDAVGVWQQAVAAEQTPATLTKLGSELVGLNRLNDAVRTLEQAIALDPEYGEALFRLGETYRQRNAPGDLELAVAQYQEALIYLPDDAEWRDGAQEALDALVND